MPLAGQFMAEHLRLKKDIGLRFQARAETQSPVVNERTVLAYASSLGDEVKGGVCGLA